MRRITELLTKEDMAILLRSRGGIVESMILDGDIQDAAIMAEFANQDGQRATLTPITLATVGLDWDKVRAIARAHWGLGEHVTLAGSEHASEPASLEHITLDSRLDWVQSGLFEEC